jgi:type I restriction enzyme, S subunit
MKKQKTKFKQTEIGMIHADWKIKKLGDELELCYGKGLPTRKRINGEVLVFGSNGIIGRHNEFLVCGPGIIIGRKGSVGEVTFSKNNFWPIDTTYFIKLLKRGDIRFWYYFLLTLKLDEMNTHSAVPGLNRDNVYVLSRGIPKEPEQCSIAKILLDLDDKIELNQQMNKNLEAIGQVLFKHWFVDFEFPNEKGKPYKSSGGKMIDSERGKIPEGWRVEKLNEFGKIICGKTPPKSRKEFFGGNVPFIKIPDMREMFIIKTEDSLTKEGQSYQDNKTLPAKSICISCIATVGLVSLTDKDSQTNQQINSINVVNEHTLEYLFYKLRSIKDYLYVLASGGSATLNMNTTVFSDIDIITPDEIILKKFNKLVYNIFEKIRMNQRQIEYLSQIRDTLLPKLMSGQIRVPVEARR